MSRLKVEEEDSDNSLPFPDQQYPLPDPLKFLTVEQALDLVSLLSYHLARNNCNENFTNLENLSNIDANSENQVLLNEKNIKSEHENISSILNENSFSIPKIITSIEDEISEKENLNHNKNSNADVTKFTDDICREKFDELKKLLSNAHKAVSNIVLSQENLGSEIDNDMNFSRNFVNKAKTESDLTETYGSISSLEVWSTPTISRSNSDSKLRAGKYHKKPAPKVPPFDCMKNIDNDDDTESQKALKATLVIKTGTIKSFTDSQQQLKRNKTIKSKPREGFSKLLTVPKNFFHNAFHKDHNKDKLVKYDDSSSINSDCSDSPSRSSSIGSQNTPTDDDTLTPLTEIENVDKTDENKDINNEINLQNKNEHNKTDEKLVDKNLVSSVEEISKIEKTEKEVKNVEDTENTNQIFRARLRIREMSRSPNRCSRKSYSEE